MHLLVIPLLFGWSVWAYNAYLWRPRSTNKTGLSWYSWYTYLQSMYYSIYWNNNVFKTFAGFWMSFNHKEGIKDFGIFSKEKIYSEVYPWTFATYIHIYILICICLYTHRYIYRSFNLVLPWNLQFSKVSSHDSGVIVVEDTGSKTSH